MENAGKSLEFNPRWFATEGHEKDHGVWEPEDRSLFIAIRQALPELNDWGDLPIGVAWSGYSQDVWRRSWMDAEEHNIKREHLIPFLAYIHYHEKNGGVPDWGVPIEDLISYASQNDLS